MGLNPYASDQHQEEHRLETIFKKKEQFTKIKKWNKNEYKKRGNWIIIYLS